LPTYEYVCLKCGHEFEKFQSMKEDKLKECPKCKGKVKRLIGAGAGTIFKGSGFYHTDYKNLSNTADKKTVEKVTAAKKSSESKSDSKSTTDNK
jgi:putative FmdB family regulatory protein